MTKKALPVYARLFIPGLGFIEQQREVTQEQRMLRFTLHRTSVGSVPLQPVAYPPGLKVLRFDASDTDDVQDDKIIRQFIFAGISET